MENRLRGRGVNFKTRATRKDGEEMAIAALGFLAAEPDRLERFLSLSGLGPHNLRAAAADPGFLVCVLDYLLGDEGVLLAFAAERELAPERIAAARASMDGP